jgi:DUF1009 family protein
MHANDKVGIICGGGLLPRLIAETLQRQDRDFFLMVVEGQNQGDWYKRYPHCVAPMGSVGLILETFRGEGVEILTLAGSIKRPSLDKLKPDWQGIKWIARLKMFSSGDDQTLTWIVSNLEKEGFKVAAPHSFLPNTLVKKGCLTQVTPNPLALRDIERGFEVAKTLGSLDIGQAVIVERELVLSVEGIEGTTELLKRTVGLKREGKKVGVLIKAAKPQQTTVVDLPTIGPDTIDQLAACGLAGVAVEAGSALILDQDQTVAKADEKGLFIYGYIKE